MKSKIFNIVMIIIIIPLIILLILGTISGNYWPTLMLGIPFILIGTVILFIKGI